MPHVQLLHWKETEVEERLERLQAAGFEASKVATEMPVVFRQLRENPPDAMVIDLSRLPSAGRDVAVSLRTYKSTRHVPIVFADGEPEKVARIRRLLPDATYTTWDDIRGSLRRAIARPPRDPVVPKSRLAGYGGVSLPKKLGIKMGPLFRSSRLREDSKRPLAGYPRAWQSTKRFMMAQTSQSGSYVRDVTWRLASDG